MTNLVVSGAMVLAAAHGARRALQRLDGRRGTALGPHLLSGYGLALIAAGVLVADPMAGFPLGTPEGPPVVATASGIGHLVAGGLGFLLLVAASLAFSRHHAAQGRIGAAWGQRAAGLVVLLGFLGVASGSTSAAAVLGLWIGVLVGWGWLAWLSIDLYRLTPVFADQQT